MPSCFRVLWDNIRQCWLSQPECPWLRCGVFGCVVSCLLLQFRLLCLLFSLAEHIGPPVDHEIRQLSLALAMVDQHTEWNLGTGVRSDGVVDTGEGRWVEV